MITRHMPEDQAAAELRQLQTAVRELVLRFDYVWEHVNRNAEREGWPYVAEAIDRLRELVPEGRRSHPLRGLDDTRIRAEVRAWLAGHPADEPGN